MATQITSDLLADDAVTAAKIATGAVVADGIGFDVDDLDDSGTTNKFTSAAEISKLAGIETGADVTDAANVVSALSGATLTGDLTSDKLILQSITAITGAATAVVNTYNTLGTNGSDYTVGLPAAGTAGRRIAFYALSTLTDIVTIDGDGSETIDGALTYGMAANDVLIVEDDGSNWRIIYRKGLVYVYADSNAGQTVTANTEKIEYEDNIIDVHQCWAGNNQFTAPRRGFYAVTGSTTWTATTQTAIRIVKNGTNYAYSPQRVASASEKAMVTEVIYLDVGDTIDFNIGSTLTRSTESIGNTMSICEVA